MDDLITQFAIEARELVQQATEDLLALEAEPASRERLESVFRAIHTLKGATGLFDFGPMLGVLHQAEDLLSQARGGKLAVDMNLIDPLMAVIEWVDDSIDGIAQSGHLPDAQDKQAARLLALLKSELADVVPADRAMVASETLPDWALLLRERATALGIGGAIVAVRYEPHAECFFNGDDPLKTITALPDLLHLALSFKDIPTSMPDFDPFRCNLVIEALSGGSLDEAKAVFKLLPDQAMLFAIDQTERPAANAVEIAGAASDRQTKTMRVESARIDSLVEIAGELVIAKNGLLPLIDESRDFGNTALARRIASRHSEIERLVSSLYTAVTRARMIPLEQVFRRFPRLVRDTSSRLEKPVDLVIEGETVEADREIVEGLFEPLLHLIRNSLDHGIEPEAHRLQNAKPRRGRILLRARQRGDQIEIEMADDGRGMDPQRVLQAAIDRGLIRAADASAVSDETALQIVFAAGFSTASSVSDLSGRGVGLDAVKRAIQRLGGTVDLKSVTGSGTSFKLKLPVSFSLTQLMIVGVGEERYGIPIADVSETHKIPANTVQSVRAGRAFVLRNKTIPLLYLSELIQASATVASSGDLKVLIVQAGPDQIGVVVDSIAERAETLTRPLGGLLHSVRGIAGTTLLGDGKVLLVLDLEELIQ